jgi:predicted lipoprotein with Yx(FWY)xxD motif
MATNKILKSRGPRLQALGCTVALALAFALSACGSGDGSASSAGGAEPAASTAAKTSPSQPAPTETLPPQKLERGTAVSTGLPSVNGRPAPTRVVVSQNGFTLYHSSKDKRNSGKSTCYGTCEEIWPPYLTLGRPTVKSGAEQSLVGTIRRKDGSLQITYAGYPLYNYALDPPAAAEGFHFHATGGVWLLIGPSGEVIG